MHAAEAEWNGSRKRVALEHEALFFRDCVTSYAKRVGGIFLFFQGNVEISQDSGHC